MAKGLWKGMLKDDVNFSSIDVKQGAQIMLMGSAETVKVPDAKPVGVVFSSSVALSCECTLMLYFRLLLWLVC